jgi:hypothetical protein
LKTALGVWLLIPVAVAGCRSDVAGGKPVPDAGLDQAPKLDRAVEVYCPADGAGGGDCPFNFCGQAKVGLPSNQFPQSGADSVCGGRTCKVGPELGSGDGFQLVCADPNPGALAVGADCSPDAAQGMRCADDSLCITGPAGSAGRFCSRMCRNDADCPTTARCLEYQTPTALMDGRRPTIGMCTPLTKIGGTPCVREADCPAAQGCTLYGARTTLRICRAGGAQSLGAACTASSQCRSGECYDRDFHLYGGQNRAYCSGVCNVNSDCGRDQTCARLVVGNNGTPGDPLDDLVAGYCRTLFVAVATTGCGTDAECVGGQNVSADTCDVAHGLCYRKAALPGSACVTDTDCPVGGECSTGPRFTGGYCQTFGCDPAATSGVNACAGPNSLCAQRGGPDEPISGCYEKCAPGGGACSRAGAGYTCQPISTATSLTACLVGNGT